MSRLGLFYFNALMNPLALLLLIGVLIVFVVEVSARTPGALRVSTGETLRALRGHRRNIARWVPALLRALGLTLLVIALARPITGYQLRKERANVIDIMLCVDLSGSMRSMDFEYGGKRRDRLFVAKQAVRDFIDNRKERSGDRYGLDRVGLILYGTFAWTACPLTLDYGVLERELDRANIADQSPEKQSTAIGSAIGLAVSRLRKSEAASKVIILLTDGRNNAGELDPITAARLAKDFDIRVYTIGAGSVEGGLMPTSGLWGTRLTRTAEGIDEEALKRIAETTGGQYYRAVDTESLQEAYAEINELEVTEIEMGDYFEHKDGFMPYAVLGSLAMLASVFSRRRWFESIP
ncbi:MAG: VWA domain-containing protein [Nitrospiraceae bacterium]|nr:VWA domain-containing protein [Nitrospiraceae bacterium]